MANANGTSDGNNLDVIGNLLPALIETFAVILLGYVCGRFKVIPPESSGAIGSLIGTILLPAAVFKAMATLVVTPSSITFFLTILCGKASIFVVVAALTILLDRSRVRFAKGGIRGIFVTQSNDFALTLPIFAALYGTTHPEFVDFIYIAAPICLVILNPIAFGLMEYNTRRNVGSPCNCQVVLMILWKVVKNPVVFCTFLGIIYNLLHTVGALPALPLVVANTLGMLAKAFSACALFTLGLICVGKLGLLQPSKLLTPMALVVCKIILAPILAWGFMTLFTNGADDDEATQVMLAAFIYSTTPTATGVFVYCSQYGMAPDSTAVAMVLCTICSAPIMYVSALMVSVSYSDISQALDELPELRSIFSIPSVVCATWVLVTCAWTMQKDYFSDFSRQVMQGLVMALALSCLLTALPDFYCYADHVAYGNSTLNRTGLLRSPRVSDATTERPSSSTRDVLMDFVSVVDGFGYTCVRCWVTAMAVCDAFAYRLEGRINYRTVHKGRWAMHAVIWTIGVLLPVGSVVYSVATDKQPSCALGFFTQREVGFLIMQAVTTLTNIVCLSIIARRLGKLKQQALRNDESSTGSTSASTSLDESSSSLASSNAVPLTQGPTSFYETYVTDLKNNGVYLRFFLIVFASLSAIIGIIVKIWDTFFSSDVTDAIHFALKILDYAMFSMIGVLLCVIFGFRADVLQPIIDRVKAAVRMCKCKSSSAFQASKNNYSGLSVATIVEDAQWAQEVFDTVQTTCIEFVSSGVYNKLLAAVKQKSEAQQLGDNSLHSGRDMANTVADLEDIDGVDGAVTGLFIVKWLKANWAKQCPTCVLTLRACNALVSGGVLQTETQGTDFLQSTHTLRRRSELTHLKQEGTVEQEALAAADGLSKQMQDAGLIKNRKWMGMSFLNVFVAKEGVDYLLSQNICRSRDEALEFMQALVDQGQIGHTVLKQLRFRYSSCFYRWKEADDATNEPEQDADYISIE